MGDNVKRILLADNEQSLLKARGELLRRTGYTVFTAGSAAEAEEVLDNSHVHLAILDLRLTDDSNENDRSGLDLAARQAYARIPKIILTQFPKYTTVREALADSAAGLAPAIDFLGKEEGIDALVAAIDRAFEKYVRVNRELAISFAESSPGFPRLCELILPEARDEAVTELAEEMEELFRRLFYDESHIRIDRVLWQRRGAVALVVSSFARESLPDTFLVVCRSRDSSANEAERFLKYAPKVSERGQTVQYKAEETTHFGAGSYRLLGASSEELHPLADLYNANEKQFNAAVKTLLSNTLQAWHQKTRLVEDEKPLDDFYRERSGPDLRQSGYERLRAKVESLGNRLPLLGSRVSFDGDSVKLDLGGATLSYPDPLPALFAPWDFPQPVSLIITPGEISVDSVFTAGPDGVWLTDFVAAGPAPLVWNHVALEAAIRFDLVRSTNLGWIYQMEKALVDGDFSRFYAEDMEGSLKKAVRAIQTIRKDANATLGAEIDSYHMGIFFLAARRLAAYNPATPMRDREIAPFAHQLLSMCMIGARLRVKVPSERAQAGAVSPIAIDKQNRRVLIEGIPLDPPLKGNGYRLLCYLYDRAGRLCDRKELFESVFDVSFDAADGSQQNKLNTAIRRLRERIEDNADQPRYLLTDPGGYRLINQRR
jgi:DNA-binding response OmpR family regulator